MTDSNYSGESKQSLLHTVRNVTHGIFLFFFFLGVKNLIHALMQSFSENTQCVACTRWHAACVCLCTMGL